MGRGTRGGRHHPRSTNGRRGRDPHYAPRKRPGSRRQRGKAEEDVRRVVPEEYQSFRDLFSKENFNEMPERTPWDHAIELVPNAKATLDCKVYPLNRNEQEQLDKFLDENLENGHIRPSKSPFASPFFFIKKKDGTQRPVQDYRKLNEMTITNRLSASLNLGTHRQASGSEILHEAGHLLGLQQCQDQGRETSRRPPSARTGACTSPLSCSSGSPIRPPRSNG